MSNKKTKENNSKGPIIAILVVVILTFVGIWWLNESRSATPRATVSPSTSIATQTAVPNPALLSATKGAVPANFLGSETAPVVIEEFADYQCGACANAAPILKEINSMYGNRIKFVFRNFPLASFDKSYDAAVAAEAAGLQDRNKFWEMQNQIFKNQRIWSNSTAYKTMFEDYAKLIGLDVERFKSDVAGISAKSRVDADLQRARDAGITSTPTVFINNVAVPYEQLNVASLQSLINAELERFNPNPK
jgi:protein-disulfide isomerase